MKKFPVISKSGREYHVKIFFGRSIATMGLNVIISEKRKGLFGREKFVSLRDYSEIVGERETLEKYSYVEIAASHVEYYEKEERERLEYEYRLEMIEKEFEEWDGKC